MDKCDVGIASMEAQLERLRLEAAEAKRQLQVAEDELAPVLININADASFQ